MAKLRGRYFGDVQKWGRTGIWESWDVKINIKTLSKSELYVEDILKIKDGKNIILVDDR